MSLEIEHTLASDGSVLVTMSGRVDTLSGRDFGQEIDRIHAEHPNARLILDFARVELMTSMGLRELLKMKRKHYDLLLSNVNRDVYTVLKMTGMTDILEVEKAFAHLSTAGCKLIGKGANGEVYRLDEETVVKVFTRNPNLDDILNER